MKKSFLKVLLMLSVLFAIIPITTATCEELTYNDTFTYEINEGGKDISIIECISDDAKITVPDEIDGLPVTVIKEKAFNHLSSMNTVTLSKNLTEIKEYAFYYCEKLQRVSIPSRVTTMGTGAFFYCSSLSSATVPDSVISGNQVFSGCDNLQIVTYKGSFKQLAKIPNAFYGKVVQCNDYMVSGIRECGAKNSDAYDGVAYFIQNEDTVIIAGEGAIQDYKIFYGSGTSNIKNVIIEDGVTRIGEKAFYEFANLESVTIPGSVTSIGKDAFYGTAYVNNDENRENGVLYINNILYDASKNTDETYFVKDGTRMICDYAFNNIDTLKEVVIPDSVVSIGNSVFDDCDGLTSVTIPGSVKNIGYDAFRNCSGLENVTIGEGVEYIGQYAFSGYSSRLKSVTLPSTIKKIAYDAFSGCNRIESVYITDIAAWCKIEFGSLGNPLQVSAPTWYKSQSADLYLNNELVTDIVIPDGVTNIGDYTFCGYAKMTSITIPDSVESIGEEAFSGCTSLTNITIPDGVTSIGEEAFSGCTSLTNITIPDGITSIGEETFSNCTGLTSVTIPDSVTSIGNSAFADCKGLTSLTIPDRITSIGNDAFKNCSGLTSVIIPDSVTSIGESAFSGCKSLTSLTISDSVTSIGKYTFSGCSDLTSVTIGSGVESISNDAFSSCDSLTAFNVDENNANYSSQDGVLFNKDKTTLLIFPKGKAGDYIIPDGVTRIEDMAFYSCKSLTSIKIPDSVEEIGDSAFTYSSLDNAENVADNVLYVDNCLIKAKTYRIEECSIKDGTRLIADNAFYDCNLKNVTIPDSVTSIGNGAFDSCYSLTNVTMGSSIENIGKMAFNYCRKLTSITIGSDVKRIGKDAFTNCSSLESVYITDLAAWCAIDFANKSANPLLYVDTPCLNGEMVTDLVIPNGVTSIGKYAFYSCGGLTRVTIPDSVTSIGDSAFSNCSGLTSVTIGSGVESIGEEAFYYCGNLTSVYISDMAKWCAIDFTDDKSNPLYYANNLYLNGEIVTDLVIPDGVMSIGKYAFYNCKNLTSVTIPVSVKSIGAYAFSTWHSLDDVYYDSTAARWAKIDIGEGNYDLNYANKHFSQNSDPDPTPEPTPAPTPMPAITAEVTKTDSDTAHEFTITPEDPNENCSVYAAVYDENGVLLTVKQAELNTSGSTIVSVDKSENEKIAKVFIWANKTLQPVLTEPKTFILN